MTKLLSIGLFIMLIYEASARKNRVHLEHTQTTWFESDHISNKYLIECYIPDNLSASQLPRDCIAWFYEAILTKFREIFLTKKHEPQLQIS